MASHFNNRTLGISCDGCDAKVTGTIGALLVRVVTILLVLPISHAVLAQVHDDERKETAGAVADLITICSDDASQQRVTVPAELAAFVPAYATAVEWYRADLNLDGRPDYFLVIERNCDERALVLVVRKADGALTQAASSDHLITCRSCRGQYDGYAGAVVRRGSFTIAQEAGSASAGTREKVTFAWSRKRHTWVISAAEFGEHSSSGFDGGKDSQTIGVALQDYQSRLQTTGD